MNVCSIFRNVVGVKVGVVLVGTPVNPSNNDSCRQKKMYKKYVMKKTQTVTFHTVVGVMASTVLAIVERISATVKRVASWLSDGCEEYIASETNINTVN